MKERKWWDQNVSTRQLYNTGDFINLCRIIKTMNTSDMETFDDNKFTLHRIKFSILLLLEILATILSIVIFIFFYKHRTVLRAP